MLLPVRNSPHLYEVNVRIFLSNLSEKYGRKLTLATVPDEEWQRPAGKGFDIIWLMGAWQRSAGARKQALLDPVLRREYDRIVPGWADEDVAGSPYAVYSYTLDSSLGEESDLAEVKSMLNRKGIRLLLDFVSNHLALDHPWVSSYPDWFVQGTEASTLTHPGWFFSPDKRHYFAHARDPNFPPWSDTAQMNFFSRGLRQALIKEMLQIAEVADGVRCDMAMLALNEVFRKTWGEFLQSQPNPESECWADVIRAVKARHPHFIFMAEAYWGLERTLQQLGFDFTYDKTFYDCLESSSPEDIRNYLAAGNVSQNRTVRFIENHDEPRACAAFGRERSLAAAVILATVPGLRLFHEGQLEGRCIRLPVQLVRQPEETLDRDVARFYDRLLSISNSPAFHEGEWHLLETHPAWQNNKSHHNLLVWSWRYREQLKIVAVNYSPFPSQARIELPVHLEDNVPVIYQDELNGTTYTGHPDELRNQGMYVDLSAWRAHILNIDIAEVSETSP